MPCLFQPTQAAYSVLENSKAHPAACCCAAEEAAARVKPVAERLGLPLRQFVALMGAHPVARWLSQPSQKALLVSEGPFVTLLLPVVQPRSPRLT